MNERRFVKIFCQGITISLFFVMSFSVITNYAQAKDINIGLPGDLVKILGQSLCFGADCKSSWSEITGPWNISGNNIYNANTGLIGIGTSTPAVALDIYKTEGFRVRGPVAFTGALYIDGGNRMLMVNTSGDVIATTTTTFLPPGTVTLPSGVSGDTMRHNGSTWLSNSVLFNNGTNVGVSNTSPGVKLDVSGAFRNSLATTHSILGAAGNVVVLADNTGTLYGTPLASFVSANSLWGGTKNLNIYNGDAGVGNVGIGLTNPAAKLDVSGTAKFGGIFFNDSLKNDDSIYFSPQSYFENSVLPPFFNVNNPGAISFVTDSSTAIPFGKAILFSGYSEGQISDFIPVQAGENLYTEVWAKTGAGTPGGFYIGVSQYDKDKKLINANSGLQYFNSITIPANTNWQKISGSYTLPLTHTPYNGSDGGAVRYVKYYIIVDYSGGTTPLYLGGLILRRTSVFRDSGNAIFNGNVGIGLTNPAYKLEISNGSINIPSAVTTSTIAYYINTNNVMAQGGTGYNNSSLVFNKAGLANVIIANGNVGIGTTNPYSKFSVALNEANANTVQYLQFQNDAGGYADWALSKTGSNDLSFVNRGTATTENYPALTLQYVTNGGNVGVGLTNPGVKLDVSGAFRNSLATTHSLLGAAGNAVVMADNTGTLYSTALATFISNNVPTSLWGGTKNGTIYNGDAGVGNVGIGTTNPDAKLKVTLGVTGSNPPAGTTMAIENNSDTRLSILSPYANSGFVSFGNPNTSNNRAYIKYDHTADLMTFSSAGNISMGTGNIGIGVTNPSAKLSISGGEGVYVAPNFGSTNLGAINILNTTSDRRNGITFSSAGASNAQAGIYVHQDGGAGTHMYLATTDSYATGPQARLTILNTGNTGVGLTSPTVKLDVSGAFKNSLATTHSLLGAAGNAVVMADNTGTLYSTALATFISNNVPTSLWGGTKNGTIYNGDAGVGNVGIGVTNPSAKLYVQGDIGLPLSTANEGVLEMGGQRYLHSFGNTSNTFVGYQAGNLSLTSATQNTFVGYQAGQSLTTGSYNVAIGQNAGSSLTTGIMNTLIGRQTGSAISTGSGNTLVGLGAGEAWSGSNAIALGYYAGRWNAFGNNNVILGVNANYYGNSNSNTVAVGNSALYGTVNGSSNIALGNSADYYTPGGGSSALSAGSALGIGMYYYRVSFVLSTGETNSGSLTTIITTSGNQAVNLSSIPVYSGPYSCTARKIYRTKVGVYGTGPYYLVTTINDNSTTSYSDAIPDASLSTVLVDNTDSIIIGSSARAYRTNQIILGASQNEIYLGKGVYTTNPGTISLLATSGEGLNNAGANLVIAGGKGTGSANGGNITFQTASAGGASSLFNGLSDRMTILGGGNVGIGTVAPGSKLQISTGNSSSYNPSTAGFSLRKNEEGYGLFAGVETNGNAWLQAGTSVNGVYNLVFQGIGGNVGIGATNPGTKIDISGTFRNSLATTHSLLGAAGNVVVLADNTGTLYGTPLATFISNNVPTSLWGGTKNGTIYNGDAGVGNVGIGTITPNQQLSVANTFSITNTAGAQYLLMGNQDSAGVNNPAVISAANGSLTFGGGTSWLGAGGTITNNMVLTDAGNLGVGTAGPRGRLEVVVGTANTNADSAQEFTVVGADQGIATAQANIQVASNNNQAANMGGSIAFGGRYIDANTGQANYAAIKGGKTNATSGDYSGYLSFGTRLTGSATQERMRIDNTGNVGIGTTVPSQKLQVSGNVFVTNQMSIGGGQGVDVQTGTTLTSANNIAGGNAIYGLNYNGSAGSTGVRGYGYITSGAGTNYGITGTVDNASSLATTNIGGYFSATATGGTAYSLITGTGNAGINVATPAVRLDVAGAFRNSLATTHSLLGAAGNVVVLADNTGTLYGTPLTTFINSNSLWGGTKNGAIYNGDAGVGSVGIGTTNPESILHLSASSVGGPGPILYLDNPVASTLGNSSDIRFSTWSGEGYNTPGGKISLVNTTAGSGANAFTFYTKDTGGVVAERVRFDSQGNVGIGTTNPTYPLEVVGAIRLSNPAQLTISDTAYVKPEGAFIDSDATRAIRMGIMDNSFVPVGINFFETNNDYTSTYINFRTGNADVLRINNLGNVGIGITNPYGKLHVYNTVDGVFNGLIIDNRKTYGVGTGINETNRLVLSLSEGGDPLTRVMGYIESGVEAETSSANGWMSFGTRLSGVETEKIRINSAGNVGVGVTNPGVKLDVSGALRNSLATTHSILAGSGNVLVMADNTGTLYTAANPVGSSLLPTGVNGQTLRNSGGTTWVANSTLFNDGTNVGIGVTNPRTALDTGTGTLSGAANDYTKAQFTITGGGAITWTGGKLKWTTRFIAIPVAQTSAASGYIDITQPVVAIPAGQVYDGLARAADSTGVSLNTWEALYAVHTVGGANGAITYQIVRYTNSFNAPSNWILVAAVNGDDNSVRLANGYVLKSGGSYSGGVDNQYVQLQSATPGTQQSGHINVSGNGLFGGSVGIGTTVPGSILSILKSSTYNNENSGGIEIATGVANTNAKLILGAVADSYSYIQSMQQDFDWTSRPLALMPNGGNVGINLTNPTVRLDISGTFRNSLATTHSLLGAAGNAVVMADNNGTLYSTALATFISNNVPTSLWGGTKNGTIYNGDAGAGNVGVGTVNPREKFDVAGSSRFGVDGKLTIYSVSGGSCPGCGTETVALQTTIDGRTISDGLPFDNASRHILALQPTWGNVGVGTTVPNQKLEVQGTVRIQTPSVAGYADIFSNANGPVYSGNGDLQFYSNNAAYSTRFFSANKAAELVTILNGGNVGIGVVTPGSKLSVAAIGTANTPLTMMQIFNNIPYVGGNGVGATRVELGHGVLHGYIEAGSISETDSSSGYMAFGNRQTANSVAEVMRINNFGNVGVGLTNPAIKLDVSGAFRNSLATTHSLLGAAGNAVVMADNNGTLYSTALATFISNNVPTSLWGGTKNGTIYNGDAGVGNVGVGTTNPTMKLQVGSTSGDGNIMLAAYNAASIGQGIVFREGFSDITNRYNLSILTDNTLADGSPDGLSINAFEGIAFRTGSNTTSTPKVYINQAGNVGIGTTAIGAKLDVRGDIFLGVGSSEKLRAGAGLSYIEPYNVSTGDMTFYSTFASAGFNFNTANNATAKVRISNAGNVGIGTTAPGSKLQINSSIESDAIGTVPTVRVLGNTSMSNVSETVLRLNRPVAPGVSYNGGVDFNIYRYNTSGVLPYTQLDIALKSASSYTETGTVNVMSLRDDGNVGINVTAPGVRLDVAGTFRNSLATTHTLLAGSGNVVVMADNTGTLFATSSASITGAYLPLTGGSLSGGLNMGGNNITNINKLSVITIDPLYQIKGIKYSTFASSIAGGVKEEYIGRAEIQDRSLLAPGEREYVVDFDNLSEGSDLWVWRQTVDFSPENVEVLITPYGGFAQVYSFIKDNKLIFRSDRPIKIHYRLAGRRIDWRNWPTKATDQTETAGFVIE